MKVKPFRGKFYGEHLRDAIAAHNAREVEAERKKNQGASKVYDENQEGRDLADRIRKHCDENFRDILGETA